LKDQDLDDESFLDNVESAIVRKLLIGKSEVRVMVQQYRYAGEVRRLGFLSTLKTKIPQSNLDSAIKVALSSQIQTVSELAPLLEMVESAIDLLSTLLSGAKNSESSKVILDPELPLKTFATEIMRMDISAWEKITGSAFVSICLKHMDALYSLLEEARSGTVEQNIQPKYKEQMSSAQESEVRKIKKENFEAARTAMKGFIMAQLTKPEWPVEEPLKKYLGWYLENDMDLDSCEWYKLIPESLQLRHALSLWRAFDPRET